MGKRGGQWGLGDFMGALCSKWEGGLSFPSGDQLKSPSRREGKKPSERLKVSDRNVSSYPREGILMGPLKNQFVGTHFISRRQKFAR